MCIPAQDLDATGTSTVAVGLDDLSANIPDPSSAEASLSYDTLTNGQIVQALVRNNLAQVGMSRRDVSESI